MPRSMPSWFAADQVYRGPEGWYIGSPASFRVGPYPALADAEEQSREITAEISRCRDNGEVVRTVRAFLGSQSTRSASHESSTETGRKTVNPARQRPPVRGSVNVPPPREGEARSVWFRTSRYFAVGDAWFFATREDIDVGPYASKAAAERDADRLLRLLASTKTVTQRVLTIYEFKSRPRGR